MRGLTKDIFLSYRKRGGNIKKCGGASFKVLKGGSILSSLFKIGKELWPYAKYLKPFILPASKWALDKIKGQISKGSKRVAKIDTKNPVINEMIKKEAIKPPIKPQPIDAKTSRVR